MGAAQWVAVAIFLLGYTIIALENKVVVDKSAVALITGMVLWGVIVCSRAQFSDALSKTGGEIFEVFIFLLAAMVLVEILAHHKIFDAIGMRLAQNQLHDRCQFYVLMTVTFFLSAILDNLTITIVMAQICTRLFQGKNRLVAVAGVVIVANAGGAWSPIGDVTTIMLWLAGKFSALEVALQGIVPSLIIGTSATFMLGRKLIADSPDLNVQPVHLTRLDKIVCFVVLASFSLPLLANLLGLKPYMGLLLGLGVVWALLYIAGRKSSKKTELEQGINKAFHEVDLPALFFFVGILLAASALDVLGVLEVVSQTLLGEHQDPQRIAFGIVGMGLVSAIVDNVPLTALAINIVNVDSANLWVLMAIAVGTGGSALVVGSAAGVVAMGIEPKLTFGAYLRIATIPALISHAAGLAVWAVLQLI